MHEPVVVVGADRRGAQSVLTRARQVSSRAIVVTDLRSLPSEQIDAFDAVDVMRVDHLSLDALLRVASGAECAHVLVSGGWQRPARMLRQGITAAAAHLDSSTMPYLALHMVRAVPEFVNRPYRKILVAADGATGSGFAALVAAQVAGSSGADLQVALLDRRRDAAQRNEVADRSAAESGFEVDAIRQGANLGNEALEQARRHIVEAGVPARFGWLHADPAAALLAAASTGGYGLMVSGMMGRQPAGRALGMPATLTREVLEVSPVDHLVVFDSVSLGVASPRRTATLIGATATIVLGLAAVTAQQGPNAGGAPEPAAAPTSAAAVFDAPAPGTGWREARSGASSHEAMPAAKVSPPRRSEASLSSGGPDVAPPDDVGGPVVGGPDVAPPDDVAGPVVGGPDVAPPDDVAGPVVGGSDGGPGPEEGLSDLAR